MAKTAGDILVETLIKWGVETCLGIPGDGINGVFESLRTRQDKIRFVQVRHEEAAALRGLRLCQIDRQARVCLATSGPGGIHLLNGIYDAKLDNQPVLAITGLQYHDLIETYTQQDVALDKLFMDACVYNVRVMGPAHVENVVELACRTALAYRQPTHITIPVDFQSLPVEGQRSKRNVPHHVSNVMARRRPAARTGRCSQRAADDPQRRRRSSFILAGRGAIGAARRAARGRRAARRRRSASRCSARPRCPTKPLHHRRRRPARHQAVAGSARELRHAADRRLDLPLYRILSRSRARRKRGPDRPRSQAHRAALSGRRRPGRRQPRARSPRCFRCSARTRTAASSKRRRRDARVARADGRARHADATCR